MLEFEKEIMIRKFIYDKIEQGYTVRKIGKNQYEFKIKTKTLNSIEKIHSDHNFLAEFLQEK